MRPEEGTLASRDPSAAFGLPSARRFPFRFPTLFCMRRTKSADPWRRTENIFALRISENGLRSQAWPQAMRTPRSKVADLSADVESPLKLLDVRLLRLAAVPIYSESSKETGAQHALLCFHRAFNAASATPGNRGRSVTQHIQAQHIQARAFRSPMPLRRGLVPRAPAVPAFESGMPR